MTYLDQELLETRESEQPAPFADLEAKEASGFLLRISEYAATATAGSTAT